MLNKIDKKTIIGILKKNLYEIKTCDLIAGFYFSCN